MNFYEQIFNRGRATGEGMTHFERLFAAKFGGSPPPKVREYTGAVPVTITADGTPLLDYLITGNTVQNGTPTPDNPITPQGTGERTENLFDVENVTHETLNVDGSIRRESAMNLSELIRVDGDYTVSWNAVRSGAYMRVSTYDGNKNFITRIAEPNTYTRSSYSNTHIGYIRINYENTYQLSDIQVNTGSTALPYEPFGVKIPISSANTSTPVYLGEVETTRRIKKYEFTGQESIVADLGFSRFYFTLNDSLIIGVRKTPAFCTHWQVIDDGRPIENVPNNALYSDAGNSRWFIKTTDYTTADDFKAYLTQQYAAGTPVTIWYVLANETTGIVNEPLMRIGDYADTLSYAQAGVTIPTNNGSTTVDVDTDVKPSEVYIKYMG